MALNLDELKEDLKQEQLAAFFGAGFGGALIEAIELDDASPEELVELAQREGIDLRKYQM